MMRAGEEPLIQLRFEAEVISWRGPSPFFFVPVPPPYGAELRRIARAVTYGWGMIPVVATIGGFSFTTSLFPKDDTYLVPLKAAVRRKTEVTAGDVIAVELAVQPPKR